MNKPVWFIVLILWGLGLFLYAIGHVEHASFTLLIAILSFMAAVRMETKE